MSEKDVKQMISPINMVMNLDGYYEGKKTSSQEMITEADVLHWGCETSLRKFPMT